MFSVINVPTLLECEPFEHLLNKHRTFPFVQVTITQYMYILNYIDSVMYITTVLMLCYCKELNVMLLNRIITTADMIVY